MKGNKEKYIEMANPYNKEWIDEWVQTYYKKLFEKFDKYKYKINNRAYSPTDILQDTIIKFYVSTSRFKSKEHCFRFMNKYFKIKE